MIPINQQDYVRYQQALKGNRIKGAELFRSLLEDKTIAPVLAQTAAAAASVFTDCSQAANQMLPAILGETEYYEEMVLAYVNAGMGTNYATLAEAAEDSRFTKVVHGRDIGQLPRLTLPGYRDLLLKPMIALG